MLGSMQLVCNKWQSSCTIPVAGQVAPALSMVMLVAQAFIPVAGRVAPVTSMVVLVAQAFIPVTIQNKKECALP